MKFVLISTTVNTLVDRHHINNMAPPVATTDCIAFYSSLNSATTKFNLWNQYHMSKSLDMFSCRQDIVVTELLKVLKAFFHQGSRQSWYLAMEQMSNQIKCSFRDF